MWKFLLLMMLLDLLFHTAEPLIKIKRRRRSRRRRRSWGFGRDTPAEHEHGGKMSEYLKSLFNHDGSFVISRRFNDQNKKKKNLQYIERAYFSTLYNNYIFPNNRASVCSSLIFTPCFQRIPELRQ